MIKFNLNRIKNHCDYEVVKILQFFYYNQKLKIPSTLGKITKKLMKPFSYRGYSYILNLSGLLLNEQHKHPNQLYEYIYLCSLRSLFDYKVKRITYLPLILLQDANITGDLYTIENNNLYFKYEENRGKIE